jgi:hypothetical protein
MMRTATLAAAIQRDLLRTEPVRTETPECACGRPFMPRPSTGDDNTHRFCSPWCREAFDNGLPPDDPDRFRGVTRTFDTSNFGVAAGPLGVTGCDPLQGSSQLSHGIKRRGFASWVNECFACGKEFERRCR